MSRLLLALLFAATAAPLAAFFAQPQGYVLSEIPQTAGTSGIVWDPAAGAADFYAHHNGGIRRFDTVGGAFSSTLLFPAPVGDFFDSLAIDPTSPDDFYVSYSSFTNSTMYKLTRTSADSASVVTTLAYSTPDVYIYRLTFVPDIPTVPTALRGQLIAAATPASTFAAGLYLVDQTTLALTLIVDVGTTNGSADLTADIFGNVYTAIPTVFGTPTGAILRRFAAADVTAAIGGTPVAASQGTDLIATADDEWNITSLAARQEGGSTFIYFGTYEHASIKRMCVDTGEVREFAQGFGGVSDGFQHFAQGGGLAFSSPADDFVPSSGGSVRLAVPFSVFTPGFGSYRSVFFFDPAAVNATVVSLTITQQPTAINSGVPFSLTLNALNIGGSPINGNAAVVVTANGLGSLVGFTYTSGPSDALLVSGLVYTYTSLPESITLTIELAGNPAISVSTGTIQVVARAAALAVAAQPGSVEETTFFGATVELRATGGTLVQSGPDASGEVSVAKVSGPGNLWGQSSVVASGGVAVFDALIIDATGDYVLEFSSPGLTSQTINVTVTEQSNGGGSKKSDNGDDGGSCTTGGNGGLPALLACLALIAAAAGLRRARRGVAAR